MHRSSRLLCALTLIVAILTPCAAADMTIIYLTRHAEKTTTSDDPALTAAGQARADNIAAMLKQAGITRVYATRYLNPI